MSSGCDGPADEYYDYNIHSSLLLRCGPVLPSVSIEETAEETRFFGLLVVDSVGGESMVATKKQW